MHFIARIRRSCGFYVWVVTAVFASSRPGVSQEDAVIKKQVEKLWFAQDAAANAYYRARQATQWEYRKKLAEIISQADSGELFLLDFAMPDVESDFNKGVETFPIEPYKADTRILKKVALKDDDLLALKSSVAKALASKEGEGGVLCHYPIHGIKLFNGAGMIFQTSLCWRCGNYYVKYPDACHWTQMGDGFEDVEALLKRLLPIPKTELDRFKASIGSSK